MGCKGQGLFMGKRVLVAGMARSGVAAASLLSAIGAEVTIYDQKGEAELAEALKPLEALPIKRVLGREPELAGFDLLVTSPGIPLTAPILRGAAQRGLKTIGELELASRLCPAPIIAVSGTNGKTTTVTLLGEIFQNAGRLSFVVGNVGLPFSQELPKIKPEDIVIAEVSSFQLETIESFRPETSLLLNITEDHLNRHGSMEEYIRLKARIFENQSGEDCVILNLDDPLLRDLAPKAKCRLAYFSLEKQVKYGCFLEEGYVAFAEKGEVKRIVLADEIRLPGKHNLQNSLAAATAAMIAGVPAPVIRHTLKTFAGVEHRIETVRVLGGVTYINDSKGTNVDASIMAVRAMKAGSVLIAGGYDKHTDFLPFAEEIARSKIHTVVLIGETRGQIEGALRQVGFSAIEMAESFKEAVVLAGERAKSGENVLLSPACASFDMFKDYEERGRVFKEIVNAL
ncbi:MAG: UDP-N-acetylmuramoyl-L-alanine--D-glutamate ligase [Christensenellaceae bacterium]|jgi:UDP-N-acetylmuramoylalanine--D-glutamate ligase|nr:UDP-N-acetylmuramoyl-L-alanine--D-glutamate ligase [Christensenellaceae bacterium]